MPYRIQLVMTASIYCNLIPISRIDLSQVLVMRG